MLMLRSLQAIFKGSSTSETCHNRSYSYSFCVDYLVGTIRVDFTNNIRVVPFRGQLAPCPMHHDDRPSYCEYLIPNLERARANLFVECS